MWYCGTQYTLKIKCGTVVEVYTQYTNGDKGGVGIST